MGWGAATFDGRDIVHRETTSDAGDGDPSVWAGPTSPTGLAALASDRTTLGLFGPWVTDAALGEVADRCPHLSSLLIHGAPEITARGLAALAALPIASLAIVGATRLASGLDGWGPGRITKLWLRDCPALGLGGLKALTTWRALTLLDLSGGTAPVSLLRWLAPIRTLEHLDLGRAAPEELGPALAPLHTLEALRFLGLRRIVVTDPLLEHVAAMRALVTLDLTDATDFATARGWQALTKLQALAQLDVRGGTLKPDVVTRLRETLSHAAVLATESPAPASASAATTPMPLATQVAPRVAAEHAASPSPQRITLPWLASAPSYDSLFVEITDERGGCIGYERRWAVHQWLRQLDPRELVACLATEGSAELMGVTLELLPDVISFPDGGGPSLAGEAIAAASARVTDGRTFQALRATHTVGVLAERACLALLAQRARRLTVPLVPDLGVFIAILDAGLARGDTGGASNVFRHIFEQTVPDAGVALTTLTQHLLTRLSDARAFADQRWRAWEVLEAAAHACPVGFKAILGAATTHGLEHFVALAADPDADVRMTERARQVLAQRSPERLVPLRGAGQLKTQPLPALDAIVQNGAIDATRVLSHAAHAEPAEIASALRDNVPEATAAGVAIVAVALALAPFAGTSNDARTLAERVAPWVGDRRRVGDGAATSRVPPLGELAATALVALVQDRAASPACFEAALAHGMDRPASFDLLAPPGLPRVVEALATNAHEEVAPAVRAAFADRARSADVRFALLLSAWALRRDLAAAVVTDPQEDPDLRALVGCLTPASRFDVEGPPVPACAPRDVPTSWLLETLRIARHPVPVERAVEALMERVFAGPPDDAHVRSGAAQLSAMPIADHIDDVLRDLVDGREGGTPRHRSASPRWLALRGDPRDEERLAAWVVTEGWVPPAELPRPPLDVLRALRDPENDDDVVVSVTHPWLAVGFDAAAVARIEARALGLVAERLLAAGKIERARRVIARALVLAPDRLELVRIARSLRDR